MESAQFDYRPTNDVPHSLPLPQPHGVAPPHQYDVSQPHYMGSAMENHYAYGAPAAMPPPSSYLHTPNFGSAPVSIFGVQHKKQMRATQACVQCRQRKQKCDEGTPCYICKVNKLVCNYRDTPPAKTDKDMGKVLSLLEQQAIDMQYMRKKVDRLEEVHQARATSIVRSASETSNVEEIVGMKPLLEGHRTAPHTMALLWRSVASLLREAELNVRGDYVMEAEDRGVLRMYTRGEGIDEYDGRQAGGSASPAPGEDSDDGSAPTPPDGLWGTGFSQTPNSEVSRSEPFGVGGLNPDGSLDLDVGTINVLYESYIEHMHVMHPFLDQQRLRRLFDTFIKRYSTGHPYLGHKFAAGNGPGSERPLKRQRSSEYSATMNSAGGTHRHEQTERSPENAIVWLVLALGKICLHKEPLPSTVRHENDPSNRPTAPGMNRTPFDARSRQSSIDGTTTGARNIDVISGLAYFAKAAEILGDHGDGNELVHAQMFLLAALYKGQLARVKESLSWIMVAGRAIRTLLDLDRFYNDKYRYACGDVRKPYGREQARIKDKRQNLIVLTSWTCLQLESDILADLPLPSSGIQRIENMLWTPHNMPDDEEAGYDSDARTAFGDGVEGDYRNILRYYTAQISLRKRLNQVIQDIHSDRSLHLAPSQVREMLDGHETFLGLWRERLPSKLQWDDNDPPAADILDARLRAKYWEARFVINRPFVDYALHIMPYIKDGKEVDEVATDVHGNPRDKADIHLFKAIHLMDDLDVRQAVQCCIDAAVKSTVSFDGISGRLIVTNIHGIAHAQFGNMLVLAAAVQSPHLVGYVSKEWFRPLLQRTITFLHRLAPISPTCCVDCDILQRISRLLYVRPTVDAKLIDHTDAYELCNAEISFGDHNTPEGSFL